VTVELARVHLLVTGRVQGVAFRAATAEAARRLGVRGWVRNLADGRVEAEAEGERAAVEALVAWCRRGPPAARVDHLAVGWGEPRGDLGPFAIGR
jgi:acylphosphatase